MSSSPKQVKDTKRSNFNSIISTGHPQFDGLLTTGGGVSSSSSSSGPSSVIAGLPIGSLMLIDSDYHHNKECEDLSGKNVNDNANDSLSKTLLRYSVSHSLLRTINENVLLLESDVIIPGNGLIYDIYGILDHGESNDPDTSTGSETSNDMKIAWRYQQDSDSKSMIKNQFKTSSFRKSPRDTLKGISSLKIGSKNAENSVNKSEGSSSSNTEDRIDGIKFDIRPSKRIPIHKNCPFYKKSTDINFPNFSEVEKRIHWVKMSAFDDPSSEQFWKSLYLSIKSLIDSKFRVNLGEKLDENTQILRLVINFSSAVLVDSGRSLLKFLHSLRGLLRYSLAIAQISCPLWILEDAAFKIKSLPFLKNCGALSVERIQDDLSAKRLTPAIYYVSDFVFSLHPTTSEVAISKASLNKNNIAEESPVAAWYNKSYHGILRVEKRSAINTLTKPSIIVPKTKASRKSKNSTAEKATGGLSKEFGLKVTRRALILEEIYLPPELGVDGEGGEVSRSQGSSLSGTKGTKTSQGNISRHAELAKVSDSW